jgi:hypothetical protein
MGRARRRIALVAFVAGVVTGIGLAVVAGIGVGIGLRRKRNDVLPDAEGNVVDL